MAILTGNNGVLKFDNSAGTPTAVASVRNFTVDITSDTIETTHMGKDSRTYLKGLSSFSGSADIYFDPSEYPTTSGTAGLHGFNPTIEGVGTDPYTVELYLDGTNHKITGEVIITGFSISSSTDGMVEASISFQGSDDVVYSAT